MVREIADRPPVDTKFGRAQENALRSGQSEIADDHPPIERGVEPADAALTHVLDFILFELSDDEAPSGIAVWTNQGHAEARDVTDTRKIGKSRKREAER